MISFTILSCICWEKLVNADTVPRKIKSLLEKSLVRETIIIHFKRSEPETQRLFA